MPKPELLETFPNPHPGRDYEIAMECPEFTALCPLGGIESDADDLRALRGVTAIRCALSLVDPARVIRGAALRRRRSAFERAAGDGRRTGDRK